jgi:hypothetical protein
MDHTSPLDYEAVCKFVGHLYLQSKLELEQLGRELAQANARADRAEQVCAKALDAKRGEAA